MIIWIALTIISIPIENDHTRFKGKKVGYIAIPKTMNLYDSSRNVPNFYHIALEI